MHVLTQPKGTQGTPHMSVRQKAWPALGRLFLWGNLALFFSCGGGDPSFVVFVGLDVVFEETPESETFFPLGPGAWGIPGSPYTASKL